MVDKDIETHASEKRQNFQKGLFVWFLT